MTSEGQTRITINKQLEDSNWDLENTNNVQIEAHIDGGFADYVLKNNQGHPIAVVEAKKFDKDPRTADVQTKKYAEAYKIPFIFLANGHEIYYWEYLKEAFPNKVKTFFSQKELEIKFSTYYLRRKITDIEIDNKITDRKYSIDCINQISELIESGKNKHLIEMATGAGKTRLAAALIKRLFKSNRINKVLFVCDRLTLSTQAEDTFNEFLPEYSTYVLGNKGFKDEKQITISTLQTLIRNYQKLTSGYYDLIFIDECHRSIYGKYRNSLDHFHSIKIGLTATPCKADEDTISDEDKLFIRDTLKFFDLNKPTFTYSMEEAINDGYLLPYYTYKARTSKTNLDEGILIKKDEIDWNDLKNDDKVFLEKYFGDKDDAYFPHTWLERKFTIPQRNKSLVQEYRNIIDNGFKYKNNKTLNPPEGKTIVFAVTKKHAVTLAKMFDDIFFDKKPSPETRYADFVVSDMGEDVSQESKIKIKKFKDEKYPKILVSVGMLDTGFDCPEVTNLVHARFTKSNILYRQMRGRGARRADYINKNCFWMFDFVGVTDYHRDDDEADGGGPIKESVKKPKPNPTKLIELDVDDWIDPDSRVMITIDDDGNIQKTPDEEEHSEIMGIKFEGWLSTNDKLDYEKEKFLRIIGEQIKSNSKTLTKIDESLFAYPPFQGLSHAANKLGGKDKLEGLIKDLNKTIFKN